MSTTAPAYLVRTIWEGLLVATIDCETLREARDDFSQATGENDGYTIQLIEDDQILAEVTNPDENGEI